MQFLYNKSKWWKKPC